MILRCAILAAVIKPISPPWGASWREGCSARLQGACVRSPVIVALKVFTWRRNLNIYHIIQVTQTKFSTSNRTFKTLIVVGLRQFAFLKCRANAVSFLLFFYSTPNFVRKWNNFCQSSLKGTFSFLYRFITQSEISQAFDSYQFDDYSLQVIKT